MLNRRHAKLTMDAEAMTARFGNNPAIRIPLASIKHMVRCPGDLTGIILKDPMVIVPGTKRGVSSFVISPCVGGQEVGPATHTACGRSWVSLRPSLVVGTSRTCELYDSIESVVLQRTKGGMTTFDAHIVPVAGAIRTVELLPHEMLDQWTEVFADRVIDVGPDPVGADALELARRHPGGIKGWLEADAEPSGSGSGSEYDPNCESESESEESEGSYMSCSSSEE